MGSVVGASERKATGSTESAQIARHFNRSVGSLSVSVLLYMFPVFFSWGSPSFQIFSALCFCVVSGAGGSVLSLLVHSV